MDVGRMLSELDHFAAGAKCIVGHNLVPYDLPLLQSLRPTLNVLKLPVINVNLPLTRISRDRHPNHSVIRSVALPSGVVQGCFQLRACQQGASPVRREIAVELPQFLLHLIRPLGIPTQQMNAPAQPLGPKKIRPRHLLAEALVHVAHAVTEGHQIPPQFTLKSQSSRFNLTLQSVRLALRGPSGHRLGLILRFPPCRT